MLEPPFTLTGKVDIDIEVRFDNLVLYTVLLCIFFIYVTWIKELLNTNTLCNYINNEIVVYYLILFTWLYMIIFSFF